MVEGIGPVPVPPWITLYDIGLFVASVIENPVFANTSTPIEPQ